MAFANAGLNLLLNIVFGTAIGVGGIALSTSVTVFIMLAFLATRISEPGFDLRLIASYGVRTLLAAGVAVVPTLVIVWMVPTGLGVALAPIIAALALSMVATYVVIANRFGLTEPLLVLKAARARVLGRA